MKLYFIFFLFLFYLQTSVASPLIVAHRAGTADFPENTRYAIEKSLSNQADIVWITIQFSKDGIPVLYRPMDLSELTDGSGPVSDYTLEELQLLDAAYHFKQDDQYIYRGRGVKIPSLHPILLSYPQVKFIIDIKSPDADPEIVAHSLIEMRENIQSPDRLVFYSTEQKYLDALPEYLNKFESRKITRKILANAIMAGKCIIAKNKGDLFISSQNKHYVFELRRDVKVVEKFTLGKGTTRTQLVWNQQAMDCFKESEEAKILLIGINSAKDYQLAKKLGADYVMVDSPLQAKEWR
ncbi:glycerophosphodiester phosphodiesterase family protein [Yersinia enterocolitica]|uniref:glycerophosphodiester phosphodiesterase family protein n=1 Tax=Yersinia enterocolitica TaxID=630 RepID=UPI000C9E9992|nr:glycerophosphodiester phosphodiesterase family protein [Yersinia enterocolitica]PNM18378.1 glycerophosphodiester phosphodiesterase [Yersinia enterocolitica]HDL7732723.1 glycerophosphodiester phosphodiesterase [Yersinia enterocolitica]HDL8470226.1 glycerophosphodiester phosphodiesterase [Yersinia enterocolitica]HDL8476877.1 glycerophosphodiester phosphodiesterase [Yersinia enterocolitica]HEK6318416.1 glycerophosphodiester phosphodiesterase [Yersinia enterocolitica]